MASCTIVGVAGRIDGGEHRRGALPYLGAHEEQTVDMTGELHAALCAAPYVVAVLEFAGHAGL